MRSFGKWGQIDARYVDLLDQRDDFVHVIEAAGFIHVDGEATVDPTDCMRFRARAESGRDVGLRVLIEREKGCLAVALFCQEEDLGWVVETVNAHGSFELDAESYGMGALGHYHWVHSRRVSG